VNHCRSILFLLFEISQVSYYKIEAQRFIFIPTKEAPALLFKASSGLYMNFGMHLLSQVCATKVKKKIITTK